MEAPSCLRTDDRCATVPTSPQSSTSASAVIRLSINNCTSARAGGPAAVVRADLPDRVANRCSQIFRTQGAMRTPRSRPVPERIQGRFEPLLTTPASRPRLPQSIVVIVRNPEHISAATEGETDLAWTTEPARRNGGRQHGRPAERPVVEDDALLDHHIEEMLGMVSDAVRTRESRAPRGNDSSEAREHEPGRYRASVQPGELRAFAAGSEISPSRGRDAVLSRDGV